eukprot:190896-Amphidinium_carterae.1
MASDTIPFSERAGPTKPVYTTRPDPPRPRCLHSGLQAPVKMTTADHPLEVPSLPKRPPQ